MTRPYCHALSSLLSVLEMAGLLISHEGDLPTVCHLSFDTRDLRPNTLFFCKGAHFKVEYLKQAAENGAVAYVSETRYDEVKLPCVLVSDIRRAMSVLALFHYDRPAEKLKTVGITGTKGKSTTAYYIKSIFDAAWDKECAILSSIDNYDGVIREEAHLTTPEAIPLQQHFVNAVESGISHLVMEVSSQALKYGRVEGVVFDVACFNNIGTDHISPVEHPDFEDYFAAKKKIFDTCRVGCVNTDVAYAEETLAYAKRAGCRVVTYGSHPTDDVYCSHVEVKPDEIRFTVRTAAFTDTFAITMPGLFNVQNALAAIAVCLALDVPISAIKEGLYRARAAGRMEVFRSEDGRVVALVDYAHNRMSFEALYDSVAKEYPGRKVITVFGCPGGKAFLRRRDLGELSGKHSSHVYITEEDSGEEPFPQIAADVAKNVAAEGCAYTILEDRGEAIRRAVCEGEESRVILITGKGRETRQKRGTLYIDTPSDVDFVEQSLRTYDRAAHKPLGITL
ncbi:MAG: UDP-N-acetylmuramoyl-L-alanyl-D-glutamate--2,6-diaminopimelate ligase [Ruminococcaceae bacterium]|nr:UDP-N-acetylmuramoyl-L-alanyl-D-glutamate--2,6-diaminopimelate ligase [Oscillospiraceae bacterium]